MRKSLISVLILFKFGYNIKIERVMTMLVQFSVKNYRSIRDEVTLNLMASRYSELPDHVVRSGKGKYLKLAAIFGANASGKSNIFKAFEFMTLYVLSSLDFGGKSKPKITDRKSDTNIRLKAEPFLFDTNSKYLPSTFEVFFTDEREKMYQYGFALSASEVVEEWLYTKAKTANDFNTIFYRKKGERHNLIGLGKKADNIAISLEKETLIVSLGSLLKISILKTVRDWFYNNEVLDFGNPLENLYRAHIIPNGFNDNRNVQKQVINYFSSFDNSIKDFSVKDEDDDEGEASDLNKLSIKALHSVENSEDMEAIDLQDESSGTLKMFTLFPSMKETLDHGGVLFVDELNARLHPLLLRNIILTFANPEINKHNSQLVFTTHDLWQLSSDVLRRDEIWFTEKNSAGDTALYSLADFVEDNGAKIRKDESYLKNYIIGKYGAIPSLKTLNIIAED